MDHVLLLRDRAIRWEFLFYAIEPKSVVVVHQSRGAFVQKIFSVLREELGIFELQWDPDQDRGEHVVERVYGPLEVPD